MRRAVAIVGVVTACWLPAEAVGAVTLGATPSPRGTPATNCGAPASFPDASIVQASATGIPYAVPAGGGVITEWRHQANSAPSQQLALRVFTTQGPGIYTAIADTGLSAMTPSSLNVRLTRIPVAGGELIGIRNGPLGSGNGACVYVSTGDGADDAFHEEPSPALNVPATYSPLDAYLVNIQAKLEADADRDGYGDETQDACPTDPTTQGTCPPSQPPPPPPVSSDTDPPEAGITKGATGKISKSKVKFKFISDEPNSAFECKLDRKPYKACTSPTKVKVDEGKHKFRVRAIDAAGNVGPPAVAKFRVV